MKKGVYTALVTPFAKDGSVDLQMLGVLIDRQLTAGVCGVVLLGTTGEAPTLSQHERDTVVEYAVGKYKGKTEIVVGCGSFDTVQASRLAARYSDMGADFLLSVVPYYNKPDDEGLYSHFYAVAESATSPVLIYNVPSRTGSCISFDVIKRLKSHGNIAGVKEAGNSISFLSSIMTIADDEFAVLCGNDDMILAALAFGGSGAVSVWSNIQPKNVVDMTKAFWRKDIETARRIQLDGLPMIEALFADTNPLPIKAALRHMGIDVGDCRLPLKNMRDENKQRLFNLLDGCIL